MIVGLTGKRCSGKNEVALFLAKKGFTILDFTERVLEPMLRKQGKPIVRENLTNLAMSLRKERGQDILTRLLCKGIKQDRDYVITGVRFKEEVHYLRKRFGPEFILISVESENRKRYERSVKRAQKGEGKLTFKEFLDKESLPTETVIPETMEMADFILVNNSTKKDLETEVLKLIKTIRK